jgi:DNA-binding CsgD family transcriptional regulator
MEVSLDEVSRVIRLVREVCDRWDDPSAWRGHLLDGACQLLGGNVGMMLADYRSEPGWFGNLAVVAVTGLSPQLENLVQPAFAQLDQRQFEDVSQNAMPGVTSLYADIQRQGWATSALNQITDESTYHASPFYQNFRQRLDLDDSLISIRVVDLPSRPEAICVDRPHGAAPFGNRDVALLKLLHDEIAPLIGVRLATEEHVSRDGLSKRLRETLSLLLEGHSEKQVASQLNLGTRTVHDYVMRLYQHFRVSSRAELLAYFIRRRPVRAEQGWRLPMVLEQ